MAVLGEISNEGIPTVIVLLLLVFYRNVEAESSDETSRRHAPECHNLQELK
jgi:hypothetical protein